MVVCVPLMVHRGFCGGMCTTAGTQRVVWWYVYHCWYTEGCVVVCVPLLVCRGLCGGMCTTAGMQRVVWWYVHHCQYAEGCVVICDFVSELLCFL